MSAWSCPHDLNGICQRVAGAICDPGMRGCELHGKFVLSSQSEQARKPTRSHQSSKAAGNSAEATESPTPAAPRRRVPF